MNVLTAQRASQVEKEPVDSKAIEKTISDVTDGYGYEEKGERHADITDISKEREQDINSTEKSNVKRGGWMRFLTIGFKGQRKDVSPAEEASKGFVMGSKVQQRVAEIESMTHEEEKEYPIPVITMDEFMGASKGKKSRNGSA